MKLEIEIKILNAQLHIPDRDYDEEGNEIGPNPDWKKMFDEAEGKSFVRIVGTDSTDENKLERVAFESAWGTDIQPLIRSCFDALGRSVAKRYSHLYAKS